MRSRPLWMALVLAMSACDDEPSRGRDGGDIGGSGDAGDMGRLDADADAELDPTADAEADAADTGDTTPDPVDPDGADSADEGDVEADAASEDAASDADTDVDVDVDVDAGPECSSACDCAQGEDCVAGACSLVAPAVFCCTNPDCPNDAFCRESGGESGLCGVALGSAFGDLVFNEVLIDGASDGDPNGDGEPGDAVGDEFVELVNRGSEALDLSDFTLVETTFASLPRHTFPTGTVLAAGDAVVIFGGGTAPEDIAGARFAVANAADPGIPFGLSLDDAGDVLELRDGAGELIALFAWGDGRPLGALSDQSWTRSPDLGDTFVPHTEADDGGAAYSPGTRADGSSF